MEFILENYIWLIVGAVVLLMIIIGYFADKAEKNKTKKEIKRPIKEEEHIEEVIADEEEEIEPESTENILDAFDMNANEEIPNDVETLDNEEISDNEEMDNSFAEDWNTSGANEDLEVPTVSEESIENPSLDEEVEPLDETSVETNDDWNNEIEPELTDDSYEALEPANLEEPEENLSNQEDNTNYFESNEFRPVETEEPSSDFIEPDMENVNTVNNESEVTEDDNEKIDDIENLEITLPSIETLNEEIKDVVEDDDVWKF